MVHCMMFNFMKSSTLICFLSNGRQFSKEENECSCILKPMLNQVCFFNDLMLVVKSCSEFSNIGYCSNCYNFLSMKAVRKSLVCKAAPNSPFFDV